MNIFVTGHHRAGTHRMAESLARETGLYYVEEMQIGLMDIELYAHLLDGKRLIHDKSGKSHVVDFPEVKDGMILQCPFLAHKTQHLADNGNVIWCRRNCDDVALSMAKGEFGPFLWEIMVSFRDEFPKDQIWDKLIYEGRNDTHTNFTGYATLVWHVKEYFLRTKFQSVVDVADLEKQDDYDRSKTAVAATPLKPTQVEYIRKVKDKNESICLY